MADNGEELFGHSYGNILQCCLAMDGISFAYIVRQEKEEYFCHVFQALTYEEVKRRRVGGLEKEREREEGGGELAKERESGVEEGREGEEGRVREGEEGRVREGEGEGEGER